jgi:hypothetical protein
MIEPRLQPVCGELLISPESTIRHTQVVPYRSWQAGIRLTDEGAKVAAHLMPAGTQLEMLLEPFIR